MFVITNEVNKFIVVQSNELVEASYSPELTTRAHKVARFILSLISPDDKDLKLYTVPISTLKEFLGYKENAAWGNFYPEMKDIADKLNKEPIVIKSGEKVTTAYFVAGYEIDAAARTITFEVSLLLKPYLLALKRNFTRYPLHFIAQLKSAYSIRLYELLCQYKTIGHRTFDLGTLQLLLGSNYEFYGNFKDKVLTIAKRDLLANTDIDFDFEEIKTARKVTGLRFTILSNKNEKLRQLSSESKTAISTGLLKPRKEAKPFNMQPQNTAPIADAEEADFSEKTLAALKILGLTDAALKKYSRQGFLIIADQKQREQAMLRLNNSVEDYFLEKLKLCQKAKGSQRNKTGFFVKALQEDWRVAAPVLSLTIAAPIVEKPKSDEYALEGKQREARIRDLKKQRDAAKQLVYESIMSDTEGFGQLWAAVKAQAGSLTSTIFPEGESIQTIFRNNGMAANLLKARMEERYPEKFEPTNEAYRIALHSL